MRTGIDRVSSVCKPRLDLGRSPAGPPHLATLATQPDCALFSPTAEERDRFFALSLDIMCSFQMDGRFRWASPAYKAILGYEPTELTGRLCLDFVHPADRVRTQEVLERITCDRVMSGFEHRYRCADGCYRWLQWSALAVPEQNIIYGVARDVTDQKQAQAQLWERDARLRSVFEQSTLGMAYAEVEGTYLEANQRFCDFLGYELQELRSLSFRDRIHAEDLVPMLQEMERLQLGEIASVVQENRYLHKDGAAVWGKVTFSAIRDDLGHLRYLSIILEDITLQKEADLALAASQRRYEDLVQAIDGIVWEVDVSTLEFIFVSQQAEEILGYPVAQWMTEPNFWQNHIHPEDRDWAVSTCIESIPRGEDHHFEYRMIAADGRVVWLEDVVSIGLEGGKPVRVQGIMIDITDRKRAEAERHHTEQILAQQLRREQLLREVTQHIRQSLDLDTILQTAVHEIRKTLDVDRALIYYLSPERIGQVIQESVRDGLPSILHRAWPDECFPDECYNFYLQGTPRIVTDIDQDEWADCLAEYAHEMGIQSKVVAPILQTLDTATVRIWGLFVVHACTASYTWYPADTELLQHVADQLAIAIHQSELYQQLHQVNQDLEYLAAHDKLTQVANRRSFEDTCQREWSRLMREQMPLSLIMADLDYFKQYNDTYGHQQGDECLRQVAAAIQDVLKRPGDMVARYGGEEFVIVLPNTDVAGAIAVAQDIQAQLEALAIPHSHSAVGDRITLSLGIASIVPNPPLTLEHLLAAADTSLYQAKALGRNRFILAPDLQDLGPSGHPGDSAAPEMQSNGNSHT